MLNSAGLYYGLQSASAFVIWGNLNLTFSKILTGQQIVIAAESIPRSLRNQTKARRAFAAKALHEALSKISGILTLDSYNISISVGVLASNQLAPLTQIYVPPIMRSGMPSRDKLIRISLSRVQPSLLSTSKFPNSITRMDSVEYSFIVLRAHQSHPNSQFLKYGR